MWACIVSFDAFIDSVSVDVLQGINYLFFFFEMYSITISFLLLLFFWRCNSLFIAPFILFHNKLLFLKKSLLKCCFKFVQKGQNYFTNP
jgi:hypothetical protein